VTKPDLYTKAVLTIVAIALVMIACNQYIHPVTVEAQGSFAGVQFTEGESTYNFFDAKTGDIWQYAWHLNNDGIGPDGTWRTTHFKIAKLGAPIQRQ